MCYRKCVKILCECVFHTCSRYTLASEPEETGPPLHVERSSSGHWTPPGMLIYEIIKQIIEHRKLIP